MVAGPSKRVHYGVFDLETQRSAAEVGGWNRAHLMKISCAVLYDSKLDRFIDFMENQIDRFIELRRQFFAHALVTVSNGDILTSVELVKDGRALKAFSPSMGNETGVP